MIIKLAWSAGGLEDQTINNHGWFLPGYALKTKHKKPMHHGKAAAIGAGVGGGLGALTGALVGAAHNGRGKDIAALSGASALLGGALGSLGGVQTNAAVRTLRAAHLGQEHENVKHFKRTK